MSDNLRNCPKCGEPVEKEWRLCPVCEHPLTAPACPQCAKPVKRHWKRCPYCESSLSGSSPAPDLPGDLPPILTEPFAQMEFVLVPGGVFMMGDVFGDGIENETPVHQVRLDRFYIGRFPVTQSQWDRLMPENPSFFKGDRRPVERVTFQDAVTFAKRLAEACDGRYRFEIPTEAQGEYAARSGGRDEKYAGGDTPEKFAWYDENSDGTTHPVGKKAPNGLGLHDMSGNVWEWRLDFYRENAYKFHDEKNPVCLEKDDARVIRGGGYNTDAWSARCARRFGFRSEYFGSALGFRLAILID